MYELLNKERCICGVVTAALGLQSLPTVTMVSPPPIAMVVVNPRSATANNSSSNQRSVSNSSTKPQSSVLQEIESLCND
jgi:hypothetical protein